MTLDVFTLVHILISLAGIVSGLVVVGGWLAGRSYAGWTAFFLATTVATSATAFFFPYRGFTPALAVGILSLLLLAVAIYALYVRKLAGIWQRTYLVTALTALYLNFFVLVAQLFQKTPALKELAPTQSEPPFGITQGLVLVVFVLLGIGTLRRFRATS
ncbi:MAG TPA: hypothetical protein VFS35_09740 [Terrimicrobiaceae bacterium]|nr:hypothetical protein [Terrimicrobiaceae bacterium]